MRSAPQGAKIPLLEKPFMPSVLAERVRGAIDGFATTGAEARDRSS